MDEKLKLETEKLNLEIKKIKRDLDSNYDEQRIQADKEKHAKDHKRAVLALWLGIITPAITIISLFITLRSLQSNQNLGLANQKINEETLRQKKLERMDKLKSEFDNISTPRERKSSIAYELMSDTTLLSKYDRERYATFYNSFYLAVTDKQEKTSSLNQEIESESKELGKLDIKELNKAEEKQVALENKLANATNSNQVAQIKNELKSITENISTGSTAVKLLDTLSTTHKELTQYEKESAAIQPEVTWLKEGYYRPYEDLVITLVELNSSRKTGTVKISKNLGNNNNSSVLQTISFSVPGRKTFVYNKTVYELDFVKIDRAGKNPFTKAVYFSIVKLDLEEQQAFDDSADKTFN